MTAIITVIITFHFHSFPLLLFQLRGSGRNEFRQPEDCFRELCRNKHIFFLEKQLKLISSDLSISIRLPVKTSIGCLSWTQKQKLGSHQRPLQSPPNLSSFFLFLGSYKASSAPSIFANVAAIIIWSGCTWVQNDRSKKISFPWWCCICSACRKEVNLRCSPSSCCLSLTALLAACVPSMRNSSDLRVQKTFWPF